MALWKEVLHRAQFLFRRSRFEAELDDEIRFHIEARADELCGKGLSRGEALVQARRELGTAARMREETRAAWQFRWFEDLAADLRYAARAFRRNPAFAAAAIICLALGIGVNTTVFSIAMEALFSRPSARDPQTLVSVWIGGNSNSPVSHLKLLRDAHIFEDLAGEDVEAEANWRDGEATSMLSVVRVTDNYFRATGIPIALGRPIQPGDTNAVVLTHGFWQRRLGGQAGVLGRKLVLDGRVYSVVGVLPRDHRTLIGFGFSPDLYVPVSDDRAEVGFYARLPQGMSRQQARARLQAASQELDRAFPDGNHKWARDITVTGVFGLDRLAAQSELLEPVAVFFAMLMGVVWLVLLIACANVAGLLLARAASRSQEIAIRLSIGAGRGRLIRQLLAESLLMAAGGAAAGLGLNLAITAWVSGVPLPLPVPIRLRIEPDWRLLGYAAAAAVASTLATGLMPALTSTRAGLSAALKRDDHQVGRSHGTLRNALVIGQLAVSIVLLCAGFAFLRNLLAASTMSPGFDIVHTVEADMRLVPQAYAKPARTRALVRTAMDGLRTSPGVASATIARVVPLNGHTTQGTLLRTDTRPEGVHVTFNSNYVGTDYFRTMGIPIVRGREFLASDQPGAPAVAILNENMARRLFGSADAEGQTVRFDQGPPVRIVGVARNSKYFTLGEENAYAWYEPYAQWSESTVNLHFLVRVSGRPQSLSAGIGAALGKLDPTAAIEARPMSQALTFALLPSRVGAVLLGATGLLGLALASVGLYGVLLYSVSRRTREIGLRVALGATPGAVIGMVVCQSLALVGAGLGVGLALAIFAVQPLAMFLVPGVRPADAVSFAAVAAILCGVALCATLAPAMRALRIDPLAALRHE